MNLWSKLRELLAYEPAVVAWAVNGGIATVLAFLLNLTAGQTATVTVITTALAAIVTAVKARPVAVSVVTGALATIAEAAAAFGLNLPPTVIGAITAVASAVLGLLFRQNLTPAARLAGRSTTS
jgi:hypothetical protein